MAAFKTSEKPLIKEIHITPERLTNMLKKAYIQGCNGWQELAEEVASQIIMDCIKDLDAINNIEKDVKKNDNVKADSGLKHPSFSFEPPDAPQFMTWQGASKIQ